jgi:hypothetical protein
VSHSPNGAINRTFRILFGEGEFVMTALCHSGENRNPEAGKKGMWIPGSSPGMTFLNRWIGQPEKKLVKRREYGAEDEIRTRDLLLGKEAF